MIDWYSVPVDAISWCVGSVASLVFILKSYQNYQRNHNPLAIMYFWIGVPLSVALAFWGAPLLFTQDPHVLHYTNLIGDSAMQACMLAMAYMLWYIRLRNYMKLWLVLAIVASISLVALAIETSTSNVFVSQSPYAIVYTDSRLVLLLKASVFAIVPLPIGYFFIRQGARQKLIRAKLKSIVMGMAFVVIAISGISNNVLNNGVTSFKSSIVYLCIFVSLLVIGIWPRPSSK